MSILGSLEEIRNDNAFKQKFLLCFWNGHFGSYYCCQTWIRSTHPTWLQVSPCFTQFTLLNFSCFDTRIVLFPTSRTSCLITWIPLLNKSSCALIKCRDMTTLEEMEPEPIAQAHGWKVAKTYDYKSLDEVKRASLTLNPVQNEGVLSSPWATGWFRLQPDNQSLSDFLGFVVRDKFFNRIKVKAPQYVALAHLSEQDSGGFNFSNMIKIFLANEGPPLRLKN